MSPKGSKVSKGPEIPGFTALSDQVFVREPSADDGTPSSPNDPEVVVIYGWGDGIPKHVAKYAVGYRELFPRAKQIIVLSPIAKAMFTDLQQRSDSMIPVLDAVFPAGADKVEDSQKGTILMHAMSNTGAINYAATLNAYLQAHKKPMPHQLFVMDSTPGGTNMTWSNLKRWSRAMTLGTAGWFPWPFFFTQSIWAVFLFINHLITRLRGKQHAGAWSRVAVNDEKYSTKSAERLYIYSKEDDLIGYEDIESHAIETKERGWRASSQLFEGSGHVGHMRKDPELYWSSIKNAWFKAVDEKASS